MSHLLVPSPPLLRGYTLRPVSARRWRVLDRRGLVIGHVRWEEVFEGLRFHAERFDLAHARLRQLGAFWSAREAVECLAYLR